ncbi:SsrA-binding protein SmpB [Patescibacteria group bacterium]|nr:SsrA-binding protein SmpB [Patescibacteria group bacterium]
MILLENRKARQEYEFLESYLAGIVLDGPEVKSLRNKSGSFTGSYIKVLGNELYLLNAQITPYAFADNHDYDPKRTRKLLLKRREIDTLVEATSQKGLSLIPLQFELVGKNIKLRFALARGKKQYERRAELRKKAIERDIQREMKSKVRIR